MQVSEKTLINTRQLVCLKNNPRTITTADLNILCDSIRENGYWPHRPAAVEPIPGTDKYTVLDGNQRLKALRRMKRTEMPCVIYTDLTDEERTDIILRSNISNGQWEKETLHTEFADSVDFDSIGLHVEFVEPEEYQEPTDEEPTDEEPNSAEPDEEEEEPIDTERLTFFRRMMGDYIYPSDNEFQIPTLLLDNQPVHLELPLAPWGAESRYKKGITTYHFYVDDYRFERLYKDPIMLLQSGCRAIVEPNNSIHDQTPIAYAIYQIYRKRYLTRYLQECGMQVWADLNVSPHLEHINRLGIPDGYNAFFTRGVTGWLPTTERHWEMAKRISGCDHPNMCVYGGGKEVEEWCMKHGVVYVNEYMNRRRS